MRYRTGLQIRELLGWRVRESRTCFQYDAMHGHAVMH
jgi:hypothetical protein